MSGHDPIDDELAHHLRERVDRLLETGWERRAAEAEAHRLLGNVDEISGELRRMSARRSLRRSVRCILDGLRQDLAA